MRPDINEARSCDHARASIQFCILSLKIIISVKNDLKNLSRRVQFLNKSNTSPSVRVLGAVKDTRTNAHLLNAAIWMQNAKAPPPIGVPTKRRSVGSRRKNFRWGHNEHALWGKGATAREQTESRFYKRLSCSLARIATPERTKTHVSTMTVALTKQFACSYTRLLSAIFR